MGLFKKLKQGMGIGTVSFDLEFPAQVPAASGVIEGTIVLTAKSDQQINDVEVKLEREQTWEERVETFNTSTNLFDVRWETRTQSTTIAEWKDTTRFTLAEGETKRIPFRLAFPPMENPYGNAQDSDLWDIVANSLIYGTGWRDARIDFKVIGDADIEDAAFDKGDERIIVLM